MDAKRNPGLNSAREDALLEIARKVLGVETLETRKSDSLDFHDIAVWKLRDALEAAFEAGQSTERLSKENAR